MSIRELNRMANGKRALLGSLARYQAIAAGLVARGVDPDKIRDPFPQKPPPPKKIDPVENNMKMRALVSGLMKNPRR